MRKSEVSEIKDQDLQLRYYLGGLKTTMNDSECCYWQCDLNCGCNKLNEDIDLTKIKDFIKKYNISNVRFLILAFNYLEGNFVYYHNKPSELIVELEEILKPLDLGKHEKKEYNTLYDEKLEKLIYDVKNPHAFYVNDIREFIKKYNLTDKDFITIAKTWINHRFWGLHVDYDKTVETFPTEMKNIIHNHDLFVEKDMLNDYITAIQSYDENAQIGLEAKVQQKKYLEAIKRLYEVNPEEAKKLIDLGEKDIKQEIIKQDIPVIEPKAKVFVRKFKDRFKKDNK